MNNYSDRGLAGDAELPPLGCPAAPDRLIVQVARLYHEGRRTQSQIAARPRVSHGTVCRLLQNAAEPDIVRGRVIPPERTFVDPEELLERKFGLAQVVIARAASELDESIESTLVAAAHFLGTALKPPGRRGRGCGKRRLVVHRRADAPGLESGRLPDGPACGRCKCRGRTAHFGKQVSRSEGNARRKPADAALSRPSAPGILKWSR